MPIMKDLSQMERDYGCEAVSPSKAKMKKTFKKVRLPLSIVGDKMPTLDKNIVVVISGVVKGVENTEHSKELTIEAKKGGIYTTTPKSLGDKLAAGLTEE